MPNLAAVASYYLNTSLASAYYPQYNVYHESSIICNRLSSMPSDCEPLDLSCKMDARESSSRAGETISTNLDTPTHTCGSDSKRTHEEAEKKDREQRVHKRQKTKTTTTANSTLMDETEVCLAVEEFGRCFGDGAKIISHMSLHMMEFSKDLALRGLTSVHSREIVELCMASEQWLGHNVFWKMLMLFMDMLSLEIVELNRLEDKKTIVLKDRKTSSKPLSECTNRHIWRSIAKCRDAERMEIECNLNVLEDRGTANVLSVLRWLLYHVNIECVGITCDLTEPNINSAMLGRQVAALTKEWRGCSVRIDSLALHFRHAHYKDAAVVVKEYPWVTVLKIYFICGASRCQDDDSIRVLKALLLHCPALEQLSVFGFHIGIGHMRTIASIRPQLMLLEVECLTLEKLTLDQKEEEEAMPVFSGLTTLKLLNLYTHYSDAVIEKFVGLFPILKNVQISAKNVTTSLIDALSKLRLLRSLEIFNGSLGIETAECLLDKLPVLECLSVGVKELDNKLAQVLSKYAGMHTLKVRGKYTAGFLASLLQPSPLMRTLKALYVCKNSGPCCRKDSLSIEDTHSKKDAMKKFRCIVEIRY
ncbi:hypothetical protein NECID01_2171 [Nematocida sp. AWRm77]|nr:hypothetical protein NECID01_2171 [Nematocida sp. AWRm77]